ncbi:MAG: hypothetical protein KAT62_14495 [Desulfuromonadales bacterium]|nr:hypothetical protein [Desulfuromonadales bacterium]
MTYDTIEEAFLFVSSASPFENTAIVHRTTEEVFFSSQMAGYDERPEDAENNDDYLWIPHKNDFDLGKPLVMDFVRDRCPDQIDRVLVIFRRPGAYSRFKDLLATADLLEAWYAFEQERTREALLQWCAENKVVLD